MTSICFVCNLPIMSHQVGLVWQGGNGWDEMVREQVKICYLFRENWDDKFSAGTESTKQTHTHVQQHNMANWIETKRSEKVYVFCFWKIGIASNYLAMAIIRWCDVSLLLTSQTETSWYSRQRQFLFRSFSIVYRCALHTLCVCYVLCAEKMLKRFGWHDVNMLFELDFRLNWFSWKSRP